MRIVSLSPHYLFDRADPAYRGMTHDRYLRAAFLRLMTSREAIYRHALEPHLHEDFTVLDYGCGPGCLAKAVAPHVRAVYAVDIAPGVIACAKILNADANIRYLECDERGMCNVPEEGCDAVYSFAVVQHLSSEALHGFLDNCRRKLKRNGRLVVHVQLKDAVWRSEDDWKNDRSLHGRLRFRFGLHCFGRTEPEYVAIAATHGFEHIRMEPLHVHPSRAGEVLATQRMLVARKA